MLAALIAAVHKASFSEREIDMTEHVNESRARYQAAAHGMQSGVAADPTDKSLQPKHLRVGVNSALVETAVLAQLLIDKGIITAEEHSTALADAMERERDKYAADLSKKLGKPVTLV